MGGQMLGGLDERGAPRKVGHGLVEEQQQQHVLPAPTRATRRLPGEPTRPRRVAGGITEKQLRHDTCGGLTENCAFKGQKN